MVSLAYVQVCIIAMAMRMPSMATIVRGKTEVILHRGAQYPQAMDAVKHANAPTLAVCLVMSNQEKTAKRGVHRLVPWSVNGAVKRLDIGALEKLEEKI